MTNYSATFHAWKVALKRYGVKDPVFGGFLARGSDFEPGRNTEEEDWTGHTGTDSILIQSDRTSMNSEPEYEQAVEFGAGVEDYFAMALGINSDGTVTSTTEGGVTTYTLGRNPGNYLPPATLINSYYATQTDASIFDDAFMNELGFTIDDNNPKFSCKFMADADIRNQPNQSKDVAVSSKLNKGGIRVYLFDYLDANGEPTNITLSTFKELSEAELELHEFECAKSIELNINNNFEAGECINTVFGKSNADKGNFEADGSMELKWNPNLEIDGQMHYGSAVIMDKWHSGVKNGARPTSQSLFQTLVIVCEGEKIPGTDTHYKLTILIPKVEIKEPEETLSGDENKTIQFNYELRTDASLKSPLDVEVVTSLAELHFGDTVNYGAIGDGIFDTKEDALDYVARAFTGNEPTPAPTGGDDGNTSGDSTTDPKEP